MMSVHTLVRAKKVEVYSSNYVAETFEFTEYRQQAMERASQVVQWLNILPAPRATHPYYHRILDTMF